MTPAKILQQTVLCCLLCLQSLSLSAQQLGQLELEELDIYIENALQEWMVPGLSIGIIKDDSIVFAKGYGLRRSDEEEPVDEHTVFAIASNTKAFTSAALAILTDEGKLGWDDRVVRHLPGFSLYDPFVSNEMRLRDLLCHRSGLKTFSGDLLWYETRYSREEVLRRARYLEPVYSFRYRYGYSNLMYLGAGQIIGQVAGMSWDHFIRQRLLQPLGMDRTYITVEETLEDSNIAWPHHVDLLGDRSIVLPYMNWENIAPADALNSNVTDLSRWIRFQLELGRLEGVQIISEEALWETRKMHTPRPVEMHSRNIWPSKHFEGYGLGWQIYDYHGCKVIGHGGGSDGMISRIMMVPEEQLGFVILTNCINAIPYTLSYYILDKYFTGMSLDWCGLILESTLEDEKLLRQHWEEFKSSTNPGTGPQLKLRKYCGIYGGELYGEAEVLLYKGQLVLDFLPSSKLIGDLTSLEGNTFIIRLRDNPSLPEGTVKFLLDESGNPRELVVDIPNPDFDFTELEFLKRK